MKAVSRQPSAVSRQCGFTIIEVLFVLAIAGLILLIVFLAIPALQRSSRNNQRKQDVSVILEAVSHWELNNSGNIPASSTDNFLQYTQLTYYDRSSVKYVVPPDTDADNGINVHVYGDWTGSPPTISARPALEAVSVYNYQKCDAADPGASTRSGAGYSDVVALYALESGNGGATGQCQQL